MVSFDDLKQSHYIRDVHADFAAGHRKNLRYAQGYKFVYLGKINPNGPAIFDYIQFAKQDLVPGCQRGAINALGNAKRAIHLTVETFLRLLCIDKALSKLNFPLKLDLLDSLQAFPTGIIKRLNKRRNLVEHEYSEIGFLDVADFVEVAEMFTLITNNYLKNTVAGAYVGIENSDNCLEWVINHKESEIYINEVEAKTYLETPVGKIYYNIRNKDNRKNITAVKITKNNKNDWMPYMDLFVYLTRKKSFEVSESDGDYTGLCANLSEFIMP